MNIYEAFLRTRSVLFCHKFDNFVSIFRVLFPSSFGVFNIMYWSYYLTQDNKKPD